MPTPTYESFSLSHAAILNAATGLEELDGDIYGINSGSIEADTDSYDNTGDDAILSTWFWFNYANITVQAGYVPFKLIALLSGESITSSGSAPNDYYSIPMYTEDSLNQPPRPMLIRMPSKDEDGAIRLFDAILYKVQFQPFSFDGPAYKDGLKLNYSGRALLSNKDEKGTTLSKKAIGRLISRPPGTSGIFG